MIQKSRTLSASRWIHMSYDCLNLDLTALPSTTLIVLLRPPQRQSQQTAPIAEISARIRPINKINAARFTFITCQSGGNRLKRATGEKRRKITDNSTADRNPQMDHVLWRKLIVNTSRGTTEASRFAGAAVHFISPTIKN